MGTELPKMSGSCASRSFQGPRLAASIHTSLNNFRQFLDPRRPSVTTPPEMREPGLPPYVPELVFPPEVILNYNQTLTRVQGISKLNFLFRNFVVRALSPKV